MVSTPPAGPGSSPDDLFQWFSDSFGVDFRDMPPAEAVQSITGLASASRVMPWEMPRKPLRLADPPQEPLRYTVKVTLDGSKPAIWRRVTVPSDVMLDQFHQVLQAAMGWTNSHLHQFTPGQDRHGRRTERILTDWDISEGEEGREEATIRLDMLLAAPGDKLHYCYDFGDDWCHTVVLEKAEPRAHDDDAAGCIAGRRACPPEDIGGIGFYSSLFDAAEDTDHPDHEWTKEVVANLRLSREDAAAFDLAVHDAAVRRAMRGDKALSRILADPEAYPVAIRDLFDGLGHDAALYVAGFVDAARVEERVIIEPDAAEAATTVFRTFLEHVGEGVDLTAAGYLKPASVAALMGALDPEQSWIGKANVESHTQPLLNAREILTRLGLLRKLHGRLLPTRAGAKLRTDPVGLWWHVARSLPVERPNEGRDAATFLLLHLCSGGTANGAMYDELDMFMAVRGWSPPDASRAYWQWSPFVRQTTAVLRWAATGRIHLPGTEGGLHSPAARLLARGAVSSLTRPDDVPQL